MEDVNEKIDWVLAHLKRKNVLKYHLLAAKGMPMLKPYKYLAADSNKERVLKPDPEIAERVMSPIVEEMETAADSLGHIMYHHVLDKYVIASLAAKKKPQALKAQQKILTMFKKRKVDRNVISSIEKSIKKMK